MSHRTNTKNALDRFRKPTKRTGGECLPPPELPEVAAAESSKRQRTELLREVAAQSPKTPNPQGLGEPGAGGEIEPPQTVDHAECDSWRMQAVATYEELQAIVERMGALVTENPEIHERMTRAVVESESRQRVLRTQLENVTADRNGLLEKHRLAEAQVEELKAKTVQFDETLAVKDRHIHDLQGCLNGMIASRADVEKKLVEAKIELAGKKALSSWTPGGNAAEEFDWFAVLQAMKADAMAEFTSFYSSTIASLGPDSAVGQACTLPAMALSLRPEPPSVSDVKPSECGRATVPSSPIEGGKTLKPDPGERPISGGGAPEIRGITGFHEGRRPEAAGSVPHPIDNSSDSEADSDHSASLDASPSSDAVFLNDGDQYNCFLNCMLQCLFAFPYFRAALEARMARPTGHRCFTPPTHCVPCQLVRLSEAYSNAGSETVLSPTALRAAIAASSGGLIEEVI